VQLDAVLADVKAWPGEAAAYVAAGAMASLDGVCARRHRLRQVGTKKRPTVERRNRGTDGLLRTWSGPLWSAHRVSSANILNPVSLFDLKSPFLRPDP